MTTITVNVSGSSTVVDTDIPVTTGYVVFGGGNLDVIPGGTVSGLISISSGGTATLIGGASLDTTISNAGVQYVEGGSTAISTTISSGGVQYVVEGNDGPYPAFGTALSTTVDGGGVQYVEGGATAISTTISSGGVADIVGGGTASSGEFGLQVFESIASNTTIDSGGTLGLFNNAVLAGTTTFNVGAVLEIGGGYTLYVSSGQTSNGVIVLSGGTIDVMSGGTAGGTVVSSGGTVVISSGGLADPTTIYVGGSETISGGGTDLGAQIRGGEQDVFGTASGATVFAGSQVVESGGTASNTTVSSGGTLVISSGGLADPTTIYAGGSETISSGGADDGAQISGGTQFDYGLASGATVLTGLQVVDSGGTASGTTINSGGTEYISSGGTAVGVTFSGASGTFYLAQPAGLSGTLSGWQIGDTIDFVGTLVTSASISGSILTINVSGGATSRYQLAGQEANTFPIVLSDDAGGTDVVLTSGVGQTLEVFFGQTSNGIIVLSGGTLEVDSGGTAINTVVSSGGSLVLSGGFADPTIIYSGGSETISSGGADDGAQISGGTQFDYGVASGATVFTGLQVVDSGGTASGTTVSSTGLQYVGDGLYRHGERHHDQQRWYAVRRICRYRRGDRHHDQ
jgi:autotransporter passenger strand-loop-strand repeat protein